MPWVLEWAPLFALLRQQTQVLLYTIADNRAVLDLDVWVKTMERDHPKLKFCLLRQRENNTEEEIDLASKLTRYPDRY